MARLLAHTGRRAVRPYTLRKLVWGFWFARRKRYIYSTALEKTYEDVFLTCPCVGDGCALQLEC